LGIYLPLITTNCAVLGVTILNTNEFFKVNTPILESFIYSVLQAFFSGLGFMLALIIMSGIRERLELSDVPHSLKDIPIAFIVAGLLSLGFMGFSGLRF
ncbi:MAG: electron transport complex subunit RsxA, partial [Candidatus Omnitrophica bacterium]|nr:electron transport complex subunit RsxA [Candidatus Omnitrophota bacterium]